MAGCDNQNCRFLMIRLFFWILLASGTPATAQDRDLSVPDPEQLIDSTIVQSCINMENRISIDPACIGDASDLCQQAPGGSTTLGISACLSAELAVWDTLLNLNYGIVQEYYADIDSGPETLRRAQHSWIAMRDADCDLAYMRYENGTMRSIAGVACKMQLTAQRTFQLIDMIR